MRPSMPMTVGVFAIAGAVLLTAQTPQEKKLQNDLKQLFPSATSFSAKDGSPPHFTALVNGTPSGFAWWTTEVLPLERGYDGPIKMLVGMDPKGVLTGVVVVEHHEPYGNISVDPPAFAIQFRGKTVRDQFKVGADVDAVSQATVTITSATRAIRNSARAIVRELLTPDAAK